MRHNGEEWAWRHYRRAGLAALLSADRYLWTGLDRTRAFQEIRLTAQLHKMGLPVPKPVAAHVYKRGLFYQADLITVRLPKTYSLGEALLNKQPVEFDRILETINRFHRAGLDHHDLNARNILINTQGEVFVIDFDKCRLKAPNGRWPKANLRRLWRSMQKIAPQESLRYQNALKAQIQ